MIIWNDYISAAEYGKMIDFAKTHCKSFEASNVIDISDFNHSSKPDTGYEFIFGNKDDELIFTLAWGGHENHSS
jgi:hypothetical protein